VAVAFGAIGIDTTPSAANSPVRVPYPSGIVAGDPLLLAAVNGDPTGFTTPTGWTLAKGNSSVINDTGGAVYTKIADGTESGSLSVTKSGTNNMCMACMVRYTNYSGSPIGDSEIAVTASTASTSSPARTALSPVPGANDMVARFFLWAEDANGTGRSFTPPGSGWNTRMNALTNVSSGTLFNCGIVMQDKVNGTDNQTCTCSATGGWIVIDVAIAAAPIIQPLTNRARFIRASSW